ncbi:MAG: hypothetical protein GC168_02305 [Candidatus Hydrogenedens sp.]|nr:hypothetical protein [Candidatus Hydrogenedens sp.]
MSAAEEKLEALLACVAVTAADEIDCDDFLDRVAAYAEQFNAALPPPDTLLEAAQHLSVCAECREEFLALLAALSPEGDDGRNRESA